MVYARERAPRRPQIIGHRGSPREARENTLPSFEIAFAAGVDGIELDVHATSDGVVVVHHDASTNSRPGDTGPVVRLADTSLEALQAVPIPGGRIPTLAEVLAAAPQRTVVYVEVKAPAIEHEVVAAIREPNRDCAVHSFDHRISYRVSQLAPEIPTGILQTSYPLDPIRPLTDAGARDLWQQWELIDQSLIERVHAAGCRVIAWTVNDAVVAQRLAVWRVDGICTDVPSVMRALLDGRASG